MKAAVRYYSKGGGTKRLAEAIADAVGARAEATGEPLPEKADVLFLGASLYAGKPSPEVVRFLQRNGDRIGRVVVFGSSAGGRSTQPQLKAIGAEAGVEVADNYFHCPGAFLFLHKGRPSAEDCAQAAAFARAQL